LAIKAAEGVPFAACAVSQNEGECQSEKIDLSRLFVRIIPNSLPGFSNQQKIRH
jgi:hypothetical protein